MRKTYRKQPQTLLLLKRLAGMFSQKWTALSRLKKSKEGFSLLLIVFVKSLVKLSAHLFCTCRNKVRTKTLWWKNKMWCNLIFQKQPCSIKSIGQILWKHQTHCTKQITTSLISFWFGCCCVTVFHSKTFFKPRCVYTDTCYCSGMLKLQIKGEW